jgi:RNA polymerase sigma factor (sigma-70 family)
MLPHQQKTMDNIGLAKSVIKKNWHTLGLYRREYDDLFQIAAMALVIAVRCYCKEKGAWGSYASRIIRNALLDEIQCRGIIHVPHYLFSLKKQQEFMRVDGLPDVPDNRFGASPEQIAMQHERYQLIKMFMDKLRRNFQGEAFSLLREHYLERVSIHEMADERKVSYNKMWNMVNNARLLASLLYREEVAELLEVES